MTAAPRIDRPQPMYGKCRMRRGGVWVPGRIWLDDSIPERPAVLLAEINGREVDVQDAWTRLYAHPITAAEYAYMTAVKAHVEQYEPDSAEANPTRAVDIRKIPAPF